jgi:hypothetical protein
MKWKTYPGRPSIKKNKRRAISLLMSVVMASILFIILNGFSYLVQERLIRTKLEGATVQGRAYAEAAIERALAGYPGTLQAGPEAFALGQYQYKITEIDSRTIKIRAEGFRAPENSRVPGVQIIEVYRRSGPSGQPQLKRISRSEKKIN